tara:strand:- start:118832 stop:120532 length:1701 start_codon:yes stop_codon:yes gene_type:complete
MLKYKACIDEKTGHEWIETELRGKNLMATPLLNKGTAFTHEERQALDILGKLPYAVETIEQQLTRVRYQYKRYSSNLTKFVYLNNLHGYNEVLFYRFLSDNLAETLPIIYTPNVGAAVKEFSHEFRHPRGLYISYPDIEHMEDILSHRTHPDINVIVVTDGEAVLGIGDQGVGSMDISIAKAVVYCLCGVDAYRILPIMLDVGTDNQQLLDDPLYMGWRHKRIKGAEYKKFMDKFIELVHEKFPNTFLHWEDFGRHNARYILEKHQAKHCMLNDDMQGTGVITLSAILSAIGVTAIPIENHRVIIFGAGTAGVGIAEQLYSAMVRQGVSKKKARDHFWLIDRDGLIFKNTAGISKHIKFFARSDEEAESWPLTERDLLSVVERIKPTILIGTSTVRGAFTEEVIKNMAAYVAQPIIFPLSNPNDNCEATPENILKWTDGKALIATGSPFEPVTHEQRTYVIAQCNNALAFPGIGIGANLVHAKKLTENMLWAAVQAIEEKSPARADITQPLLPGVVDLPQLAINVAIKVAEQAVKDGVAGYIPKQPLINVLHRNLWKPQYKTIKAV